jgi:hypothetical protein
MPWRWWNQRISHRPQCRQRKLPAPFRRFGAILCVTDLTLRYGTEQGAVGRGLRSGGPLGIARPTARPGTGLGQEKLAALHLRDNTFPAEVLLELAAEAIGESGASPAEPMHYEGWEYAFCALLIYGRAAAERTGQPPGAIATAIARRRGVDLERAQDSTV